MKAKELILFLILALIFSSGLACGEISTKPEKVEELIEEDIEEDIGEETKEIIQDFYVGERLVIENFCEFIIHSVENYKIADTDRQPEEGFRLIAFDVEIKNISDEILTYNVFNYEAQDSDGYVYGYGFGFSETKDPFFSAGDISPGQTRRGWVTIQVKEDSEIVAIIAQPLFQSSPTTIKLHTPLKP